MRLLRSHKSFFCHTSVDFLKDQIEPVRLLKVLDKLYDVWMSLAVVEHLNLLEDTSPRVARNLRKRELYLKNATHLGKRFTEGGTSRETCARHVRRAISPASLNLEGYKLA